MQKRGAPLAVPAILAWAEAHRRRYGEWPTKRSGVIAGRLRWQTVDQALRRGWRGLPGGSSLAQLLWVARGVPVHGRHWRLSIDEILTWADAFRALHGDWPSQRSGAVAEMPGPMRTTRSTARGP